MKILGHVGAVVDDDLGLEKADGVVNLIVLPVEAPVIMLGGRALVPGGAGPIAAEVEPVHFAAVEPEDVEAAVLGEEFLDLAVVLVAHGDGALELDIGQEKAGITPVERGIIEADAEAGGAGGAGVFGDKIAVSGGFDTGKGVGGIVEEAEAVVMARGEDHVFHAGGFGDGGPVIGVEIGGIELIGEFRVFPDGDLFVPLDPFAAAEDGVEAEVDEHAKAGLAPPGDAGFVLFRGFGESGCGGGVGGRGRGGQEKGDGQQGEDCGPPGEQRHRCLCRKV